MRIFISYSDLRSPIVQPQQSVGCLQLPTMIHIVDVTTKRTVDVTVEERGMESVQCLMERACTVFGVSQILKLVVGDLVVPQADWTRHSVDTYMLLGEPWMVKCFVEYKSDGPILIDFEGVITSHDLGPQNTLGDLVDEMFLEKGIPAHDVRLIYNSDLLCGSKTPLATWGVRPHSTLYLLRAQRGGGGLMEMGVPLSFVSIDDHSLPTRRKWSAGVAPFWWRAKHGLSIEGVCTNPKCESKGNRVLVNFGYTTLSLVEDVHLCCCPACKSHVEPVTCAFNNCYWSLYGRKRNAPSEPPTTVKITEKYADNAWHCYDNKQNGTAQWLALVITARKARQDHCWECCSFIDGASERVLPCGHRFHSHCISESGACQRCQATLTAFQRIRSAD